MELLRSMIVNIHFKIIYDAKAGWGGNPLLSGWPDVKIIFSLFDIVLQNWKFIQLYNYLTKWVQNFTKPSNNWQCGKISPNLVTLIAAFASQQHQLGLNVWHRCPQCHTVKRPIPFQIKAGNVILNNFKVESSVTRWIEILFNIWPCPTMKIC